ncbi:cyclin [Striga asiatica]|uniref:Cyclin n=1 Tax=Striga asiatica TaxID=4170 RepID=A0A5A7PGY9_STRAF|nr:cyclin [Striga asiatica]
MSHEQDGKRSNEEVENLVCIQLQSGQRWKGCYKIKQQSCFRITPEGVYFRNKKQIIQREALEPLPLKVPGSRPVREDPKHKDYASRLQDEMEKVDAFKRGLDMCLILLRNGAEDVNNDMTVVEYVEDMYKFYKSAENEGLTHNYIDPQSAINEKIHRIMINWYNAASCVPQSLQLQVGSLSLTTCRGNLRVKEFDLKSMWKSQGTVLENNSVQKCASQDGLGHFATETAIKDRHQAIDKVIGIDAEQLFGCVDIF